jgi:lipocalin
MESQKVSGLKVRFLGKGSAMTLTHGKVYEVMAIEDDCYRVIDDTDEDYLYLISSFETVEE